MEYFIGQFPGRIPPQYHRRTTGGWVYNGMPYYDASGRYRMTPYEAPVAEGSQGWVTIAVDIVPWTAGTIAGGTYGDPDAASTFVLLRFYKNGVLFFEFMDAVADWTGYQSDQAFDICLQGSQIGGDWVGHPDDPVGYSRYKTGGSCISGGTAPNACTITVDGYTNRAADFPNTFEVDHVRVWKYLGAS